MTLEPMYEWWRGGWRELCGGLAPVECAGCGAPPFRLCTICRTALQPQPRQVRRSAFDLQVWSALSYADIARNVMIEFKSHGSRTLAKALAPALPALGGADPAATLADLLIIPPSRPAAMRERGFRPVELIARTSGLRPSNPFRVRAGVQDQRSLGQAERRRNLAEAFELKPSWASRLRGADVLLCDDVLTTGATLAELRAATLRAGARVVGIWAVTDAELAIGYRSGSQ